MGQLTLPEGRLFGAIYESALYGVNFVLVFTLLCLFLQQKKRSKTQRVCTSLICVIFVLCTVHLASVLHSIDVAFFHRNSAEQYFNDRCKIMNVLQNVAYGAALVLADGLMIHRLHVIFNRSWWIVLIPGFSLVATIVSWICLIYAYRASPPGSTLYSPLIGRFAPTAFILSFFTNVIITVMVTVRLMLMIRTVRDMVPGTEGFNRRFLAYTVESGSLYPVSMFVTGVLYFVRNNALEILSGANMQVLCIVPILLSLQMRLNLSIYDAAKGLRNARAPVTVVNSTLQFRPMPDDGHTSFGSLSQVLEGDLELAHSSFRHNMPSMKDPEAQCLSPEWCLALQSPREGDITNAVEVNTDHTTRTLPSET